MNIYIKRSCLSFVLLSAIIEVIQANKTESNSEDRQGRVNGRIVKIYSGSKPDPFICLDEGFKADPVDCSVFYRCVKTSKEKYNVFRYRCGPGTVYDPENEVCNYPHNTKRSECNGLIPLLHDTNEENEIEYHELPSPITTKIPVDLGHLELQNATLVTRTTVEPVQLDLNSKTTTVRSVPVMTTNKYEVSLPAYPWIESKNDTNQMLPLPAISPTSDISYPCIADGFIGDSENCRKFYRCVRNSRGSFTRYEYLCGESTIWDDNIQSCNHIWSARNSRCGLNDYQSHNHKKPLSDVTSGEEPQVNYDLSSTNEMLEQNNVEYESKIKVDKIESNHIQEHNKQSAHWTQHETNYVSEESSSNAGYGSEDRKTIAVSQSTQWPQDGLNYIIRESPINAEYGSNVSKTTVDYSSEKPHFNKTTRKSKNCTQSGFMGDPKDCSRFYRCVDNGKGSFTKYEFTCSQGTVWDSKAEACNHAWAVQECGGSSSNKDVSPTNGPIQYETSFTATSSSSSSITYSSNYHSSSLPSQTITTTKYATSSTISNVDQNNNNYYFNEVEEEPQEKDTTRTTVSLISSTTSNRPFSKECEETGFFGDQNNCQIFYRCVNSEKGAFTKYEYRCGEGTLWDQDLQACNHAWAVKSCGQQSVTSTHKTTKTGDIITTNAYQQATTLGYVHNNEDKNSEYNTPKYTETSKSDATVTPNTPRQPITQENICQAPGFIGDYDNCQKFYRCVDNGNGGFIQHEFICGEGTAWDPDMEACNYASAVKRCGGTKDIEEEIQSNTQINTDNGYTTQNYNSQSTMSSSQIPSSDTTNIVNENLNNGYTTQNYNTQSIMSSSEISTLSPATISSSNECKSNGFVGDKNDCKKFYRCVESESGVFERYEFFCGDGTLWDPKIQACNHATEVKECNNKGSMQQIDNVTEVYVKPTTDSIDENENGYITQNINEPVYSSPSSTVRNPTLTTLASRNESNKCQSSGFVGDENDCQKFYRCVDDGNGAFIMYEFTCSEGTAWDSTITACNHAWAVEKCGSNQNELLETTSHSIQVVNTTTQQTTVSTIESSKATSQTQISNTPVVASTAPTYTPDESSEKEQKCKSEGYFANENDCRKFFRCVFNGKDGYTKYEFDCGEGTVWVQEIQTCDHDKHTSNCTSSVAVITTSTGSYEESPSVTSSIDKPNMTSSTPSSTTSSTISGTISSSQSSTISSTTTDKSTTSFSNPVESKPSSEQTGHCKNEGYFGDIEDCKKFYRCVNNEKGGYVKYDYTCGEGTIWDSDIVACNHPQDVTNPSCKSDNENTSIHPSSNVTTTEKDSGTITSSLGPTSESSTTTSESSSSTSNVSNETTSNCTDNNSLESSSSQNITCQKAGYYADPYDCKKFYRCVDWEGNGEKFSVFHFECSDGTIWDPALETCNHKDSVYPPRDCSGHQQQNENVTESVTTTEKTTTSKSPHTTQKSTTQSLTTTKQTTTQLPTTEQPTTQSSTSEQSTTQSSTSEQSTTQSSTSEQSTTQSSTSEQSTTQSSTTELSTTQSSTTEQSTTQSSTSEQSTTQLSTSDQTTTQSSTSQQSTTQSSTTEQFTTQLSTSEQSTTQSSTSEQSTTQISTSEQSTTQSSTSEQSTMQSSTTEPTTTQSNQEQTTKSSTEQTGMTETTTEQVISTTADDNISQITEVQSTTTESTTTEVDKVSSTEPTTSNQECPYTDGDQSLFVCPTSFKRHPKYCNLFYQCIEDNESHEVKVAVFNCPNNTIYDETKVQCVEEKKSDKKCNGQMAEKHRVKRLGAIYNEPILVTEESMACTSAGHFPFEINEVCSEAFLKCELTRTGRLRSYLYKCPEGFIYWKVSRRCEPIRKVKDCKRSSYPWKRRYDLPLETYNIGS